MEPAIFGSYECQRDDYCLINLGHAGGRARASAHTAERWKTARPDAAFGAGLRLQKDLPLAEKFRPA